MTIKDFSKKSFVRIHIVYYIGNLNISSKKLIK
jgi:hypothetical protein